MTSPPLLVAWERHGLQCVFFRGAACIDVRLLDCDRVVQSAPAATILEALNLASSWQRALESARTDGRPMVPAAASRPAQVTPRSP